jgi:2-methylcitrate dehydratase PrpD
LSSTAGLLALLARPVAQADRVRAALHVLDWLGCAAAGAATPPGRAMIAFGRTLPAGACRAFGGLALTGRDAALVNGSLGNVLEMDDLDRSALLHPGPVVVPVALAAAAETGASGAAALDAIVRGYEAMIRVGRSVGAAHYRQFHNTATCGVFGAAAAAGSLLGLDPAHMADAFGNAGTQASGLWQCRLEDCMSKQLHNGRAAQSGLLAAQLARHGFTGAHAILEGPLGFFAGFCPDARPECLLEDPDGPWLIHRTSLKPWPACRHAHPLIDAALAIRSRVDPARIARIAIEGYRDAIGICDNPSPRTPVEAKFSLQHAVAVALARGAPTLADFDAPAAAAPELAALRVRVALRESAELSARYPAHFGAAIRVEISDGTVIAHSVADALGDPENPLAADAVAAKARMLLAAGGFAPGAIDAAVGAAHALPGAAGVSELAQLLR